MNIINDTIGCQCDFCRTYERYIWATVLECGCECHLGDDLRPSGHNRLCCEFPNGKKKDNPYDDLFSASKYKKILDIMEEDWNASTKKAQKIDKKVKALIVEYNI